MKRRVISLLCATLLSTAVFADSPSVGQVFDSQFQLVEREIVGLVEAMPASKFDFTPSSADIKGSDFQGVRSFAQQAKHLATNIYDFSAAVLGEKPPVEINDGEGPRSVQTKEQVVAYLKGSFAYGHKALLSLTEKNQMEHAAGRGTRLGDAVFLMWHSLDHYGQMVEYARMNGVVPPASQPGSR